uniref:Uncharacterized protein n=1 Tax=Branchiostoma floridae TaxID=7739 RepID=C3XXB2_BRAFL|eukprot:XP_002611362.1 hypothetical protein BRAFLDRAFT_73242 [Branchiostoma floridae]
MIGPGLEIFTGINASEPAVRSKSGVADAAAQFHEKDLRGGVSDFDLTNCQREKKPRIGNSDPLRCGNWKDTQGEFWSGIGNNAHRLIRAVIVWRRCLLVFRLLSPLLCGRAERNL